MRLVCLALLIGCSAGILRALEPITDRAFETQLSVVHSGALETARRFQGLDTSSKLAQVSNLGTSSCPEAVAPIQAGFLAHPTGEAKRIEFFWIRPEQERKWPVLILIHGHQPVERIGGCLYVKGGWLHRLAQLGMVVVAISQPGYGNSDGPPDFSGPFTQAAVKHVIAAFRQKDFVDPKRVGLFGYSRGAIVASMVATQDSDLAAVVLGAGIYDMKVAYPRLHRSIQENYQSEAGLSDESFHQRSALLYVHQIRSAALILHGEKDENAPTADQARVLADGIGANGVSVELALFPDYGHRIPAEEVFQRLAPFLERYLRLRPDVREQVKVGS